MIEMVPQTSDPFAPRAPVERSVSLGPPAERPVGEIVADLWHNTEKLVRQEMQLGLAEIDERVDRLKTELMLKAAGVVLMLGGFLATIAALIMLLAKAIDPWLSALIVGVVLCGVGYAFEQKK